MIAKMIFLSYISFVAGGIVGVILTKTFSK